MSDSIFKVPIPTNEKVLSYAPRSAERKELQAMLKQLKKEKQDIPMKEENCYTSPS